MREEDYSCRICGFSGKISATPFMREEGPLYWFYCVICGLHLATYTISYITGEEELIC